MNKILLSLGTVIGAVMPSILIVSCNSKTNEDFSEQHQNKEINFSEEMICKLNLITDLGVKNATFINDLRIQGKSKCGEIILKFNAQKGNDIDVVGISPREDVLIVLKPENSKEEPNRVDVTINGHKVNDENLIISRIAKELIPDIENYQKIAPKDK